MGMRKVLFGLVLVAWCGAAHGQSSPGFTGRSEGNTTPLTAAALNSAFVGKQDYGGDISTSYAHATGSSTTHNLADWLSYLNGTPVPNPFNMDAGGSFAGPFTGTISGAGISLNLGTGAVSFASAVVNGASSLLGGGILGGAWGLGSSVTTGTNASIDWGTGAASFGGDLTLSGSGAHIVGSNTLNISLNTASNIFMQFAGAGTVLNPGTQFTVNGPVSVASTIAANLGITAGVSGLSVNNSTSPLMQFQVNGSGTWGNANLYAPFLAVVTDNIAAAPSGMNVMYVKDEINGSSATGPRTAIWGVSAVDNSVPNLNGDVLGGNFQTVINAAFGNGSAFGLGVQTSVAGALGTTLNAQTGADSAEFDMQVGSGTSISRKIGIAVTETAGDASQGINGDTAILLGNAANASAWKVGIGFGDYSSSFPVASTGTMIGVSANALGQSGTFGSAVKAASAIDVSQVTLGAFVTRYPFNQEMPLQARGVSSATRLTSDGGAASSFLSYVTVTTTGTGYTAAPTTSVTGCTGATVQASVNGGTVIAVGVTAAGSACRSNASISFSGGGGSGAVAAPVISGNTLNLPPNSTVEVHCIVVAQNSGDTEQIGEHIYFGATQGATPATTTILGTPSWVSDFSVGTPTITFGTPTADTTLGAINLTVTPSAGTWSVGGSCHMVGTAQVL